MHVEIVIADVERQQAFNTTSLQLDHNTGISHSLRLSQTHPGPTDLQICHYMLMPHVLLCVQ